MKSSKKKPPPRWPKGHPQAGKFANRELLSEYTKTVRREKKNANDRARRQAQRDLRTKYTLSTQRKEYKGWGEASTSRLREGGTYKFHGAYKVTAGGEQLKKILAEVGSDHVKPTALGDGNYEVILTPGLGNFTPDAFYNGPVQSYDSAWFQSQFGRAGNVEFLGAFWRPDPK